MESYEDLIAKYHILLQNEKRRLIEVNSNLSDDSNKLESDTNTAIVEKCSDDDSSTHDSLSNNGSLQIKENISDEREVSSNISREELPVKDSPQIRTKSMEQWVSDSFYTSFPSYKKQDRRTATLADDRRQDYKKYLAEVSNKKLLNVSKANINAGQIDSGEHFAPENRKFSTRDKLLDDLKHSELAFNFLNPDAIQERNQKIAAERTRKKVELKQELMRQIEEKKREIEQLRAKEKREDEILTKRLETQMKAMQLDEDLRNKKIITKVAVANPINNMSRICAPTQFDYETEKNKSIVTTRRSYSENDKSKLKETSDREIYKFFSNSAPHNDYNANCNNTFLHSNESQVHHITALTHMNQQCDHCQILRPVIHNSCCHTCSHKCCNLITNMDICNNCRLAWIQSWYNNRDMAAVHGARNSLPRDINRHLKQPQILEITNEDHDVELQSPHNGNVIPSTYTDTHSMKPVMNVNQVRTEIHSSTNADKPKVSIRHASKTLTNEELKRKNDILIANYAKNYGSLRKRRQTSNKTETDQPNRNFQNIDDSFPLPLMREHFTMAKSKDKDVSGQSQAVKKLGYKWEIPVVQKQLITNRPSKIFTQVGAIAKQLQLEKLNFSDN